MKKQLFSLLLCLCLLGSGLTVPACASFTDIRDPDTALAANVLTSMGLVSGVGGGRYSPDTVLTRAQFCVLMIHTLDEKELVNTHSYKTLFTDVAPGSWYSGYVNLSYDRGLLAGYGDGTFGPDDPVTYGQAATLLLRILGYTSQEVGKIWPTDYVNYAHALELDKGLSLSANDRLTRAQAAVLLYNTLRTEPKDGPNEFYMTFGETAAIQPAIVLDTNAVNGTAKNQLMVCTINATGASIEYFSQKNQTSPALVGYEGDLLKNSAGKVLGFMPSGNEMRDVTIASAKVSGITDTAGVTHRIPGSAVTILGDELYAWNDTGYLQANAQQGRTARLYFDDNGSVRYVYLFTGRAEADTQTVVAQTDNAASELVRRLSVTAPYTITKNGAAAQANDLTRYDTAYFDKTSRTLCASDYQLSGFIQAASPSLDGAQTITVAGCTLPVLESAWDSLEQLKLGDWATLLLTDDKQVAFATSDRSLSRDMVGVLSMDGSHVTLCSSGLVVTHKEMDADTKLRGRLVLVNVSQDEIRCRAYTNTVAGTLNVTAGTLGSYPLAPALEIYDSAQNSWLYSLDGQPGVPSTDFDELFWTNTLAAGDVKYARLNSAGQVDMLVLDDVTGNAYQYGQLSRYSGTNGILLSTSPRPVYGSAAELTNGAGVSQRFLFAYNTSTLDRYHGVALHSYSDTLQEAAAFCLLHEQGDLTGDNFSLKDEDWSAQMGGSTIPVSDQVQVYIAATDRWLTGHEGMRAAVASGQSLSAWYDRTPSSGGQVRVLVIEDK